MPTSKHPGGVIVAFCNTTARYLREDIDYMVHWQLMTPDGINAKMARNEDVVEDLRRYVLNEEDY